MFDEFIFDLKAARKTSGLSQADCGHLLGVSNHVISQIERGKRLPTVMEICALSVIYGKSFESFYSEVFRQVHKTVESALTKLPDAPSDWPWQQARSRSMQSIVRRLEEMQHRDD